jgi:flagellar basal-body rod protein FlgB
MALDSIPLFAVLKSKMNWHQQRQTLLAQNVAHADTPGFKARDFAPFKVEEIARRGQALTPVGVSRTSSAHIQGTAMAETRTDWNDDGGVGQEITPDGNGVILEEEMIKVSGNAYDYQVASMLYTRSLGILKTALRGRG